MPTFSDWGQAIGVLGGFITGFLPYMSVNFESLPIPFMTRDLLNMWVYKEPNNKPAAIVKSSAILFINFIANPILTHMNKRGVLTSYWTLNDNDEILYALSKTSVTGILTDRPEKAKKLVE